MRRRIPAWVASLACAVAVVCLGGCASGLGPKTLRTERPDYNNEIVQSSNSEMLRNLVRLRYSDTPLFLELGTVVSQYSYEAAAEASADIASVGTDRGGLRGALGYSERPTVTYVPLAGDAFAERMLTPIPLDFLTLFVQTGWSTEDLLLLVVQRINDVYNARNATGPTPEERPDYEDFAEFAAAFSRLERAAVAGLNWEMQGTEKDPPGRDPHFWVAMPTDPDSPHAADVATLRRLLALDAERDDFELTAYPFKHHSDEVGLRCRSLMGTMYFLSKSVQVPTPHLEAGLATVTQDDGEPFDWARVTGKLMTIRSQPERPDHAFVAIEHRGWWFYIADDDPRSKATFNLLNILFALQAATGEGKSPLLTLPLGR